MHFKGNIKKNVHFSRALAIVWAFIFVQFFRYSLDQLYPFWAHDVSLSLFAFTLLLFSILSFSWFFYFHAKRKKKSTWFTIFSSINIIIALIPLIIHGVSDGIAFFTWLITPLIFLQFFILCSKFSFFLSFRLELISGSIIGLMPIPILQDPFILFLASYLLAIFPNRLLLQPQHINHKHVSRMQSFRLAIDFLRFLFLGLSYFAIFDHFREYFYVTTIIILLATLLQVLILKFDHKKHHIKHGLFALAAIFIILGIGFSKISPSLLWAFAYGVLVIWEALYFKKSAEGYLNREHVAMVTATLMCTFFYFITYEWVLLIVIFSLTMVISFLLYYIAKPHRLMHSVFFIMAIIIWIFTGSKFYSHSLIKDFWQVTTRVPKTKIIIPINFLLQNSIRTKQITTNLFPVSKIFSNETILKKSKVTYKQITPISLSYALFHYRIYGKTNNRIFLIDLRKIRTFRNKQQRQQLFNYINKYRFDQFYFFYADGNHYNIYNPVKKLNFKVTLNTFKLNKTSFNFPEKLFKNLVQFHYNNHTLIQAKALQKFIIEKNSYNFKEYLMLSKINGNLKEIKLQIKNLEKAIQLSPKNMLSEKKLLMELYYYSGDASKSEYMAQTLLNQENQSPFEYFRWLLKLYSEERDRYKLQQFYFKLKYYSPKSPQEELEKRTLLNEIHEALLANPSWFDIINEEKKREEKLKYPE